MTKRLRSLSGLDAGFLYLENAGTPMHVGSVMLIEIPKTRSKRKYDFQSELMVHLQHRLPQAAALRRVLTETPLDLAHPMWMETDTIDLKKHVMKKLVGIFCRQTSDFIYVIKTFGSICNIRHVHSIN